MSEYNKILSVKLDDVPANLRAGAFFQTLHHDDSDSTDNIIEIPAHCFPNSGDVDFAKFLRVHQFWGLEELPNSLLQYCTEHEVSDWEHIVMENLETPVLNVLNCTDLPQRVLIFRKVFNDNFSSEGRSILFWAIVNKQCIELMETLFHAGVGKAFIDEAAISVAVARTGRLDWLKVLHEEGYPMNRLTCSGAASGGFLECLEFLRSIDCPWDATTPMMAGYGGALGCLEYAVKHRCPRYDLLTVADCSDYVALATASGGNMSCLKYMEENFIVESFALTMTLIDLNHAECLQYYVSKCLDRFSASSYAEGLLTFAANKGHVECFKSMVERGGRGFRQSSMLRGIADTSEEIAAYIHARFPNLDTQSEEEDSSDDDDGYNQYEYDNDDYYNDDSDDNYYGGY